MNMDKGVFINQLLLQLTIYLCQYFFVVN